MKNKNNFGKIVTIFGITLVSLIAIATFTLDKLMKSNKNEIIINKALTKNNLQSSKKIELINNIPSAPNNLASQIVPQQIAIANNELNDKTSIQNNFVSQNSVDLTPNVSNFNKNINSLDNNFLVASSSLKEENLANPDILYNNIASSNNPYLRQDLQIQTMQKKIDELEKSQIKLQTNSIHKFHTKHAHNNNIKNIKTEYKPTIAVVEDRAWLQDKQGNEYTVSKDDKLADGSQVKLIDDENNVIIYSSK